MLLLDTAGICVEVMNVGLELVALDLDNFLSLFKVYLIICEPKLNFFNGLCLKTDVVFVVTFNPYPKPTCNS